MFYHLCNIEIDEVQRSVHQNDGQVSFSFSCSDLVELVGNDFILMYTMCRV